MVCTDRQSDRWTYARLIAIFPDPCRSGKKKEINEEKNVVHTSSYALNRTVKFQREEGVAPLIVSTDKQTHTTHGQPHIKITFGFTIHSHI